MTSPEVIPVADFRAALPDYLRSVEQDRRARVFVGARRNPQGVLMNIQENVPASIRRRLLSGFVAHTANDIIRTKAKMGGKLVLVGDSAGAVFQWLWQTDPDETVLRIADLMAEIHRHNANPDPDITLDEVLEAFERAMPDMSRLAFADIATECRKRVPKFYENVHNPIRYD
ncbi:hypothetical protein ACM0AZ_25200 [Mycobacteroides abscessus subsp. massiliense]|uniref:hypothetical protein n=1 Tax=Mycobacteroides abscessus TaxID=36809 RepID=UPI000A5AA555|nr:hypothetical protein [Mycobacteroides abscessus]MBN7567130.1 hypothetical protein [Mycobacteroides abscessus subsp. massiliense]